LQGSNQQNPQRGTWVSGDFKVSAWFYENEPFR